MSNATADLNESTLQEFIQGGESKTVEFKSRLPPDGVLAKHISAFANSDGGLLIVGIGDKGRVLGLTEAETKQASDRIIRLARVMLSQPVAAREIVYQGQRLIYAHIPKAPAELRPVRTAHGEIFDRFGALIRKNDLAERLVSLAQAPEVQMKRQGNPNRVRAFVAMSFREEEEPALVDYYAAMQRACAATKLPIDLSRVDLIEGDYEISQKIMDAIDSCEIMIADFTLNSRNVYFELGYARGRRSVAIIQTAKKGMALEFDIRNWRTLFYKNATELEEGLQSALRDAYEKVAKSQGSTAQS